MESELGLFEKTIDDVYFWEYLRLYVFNEVQRESGLVSIDAFVQRKTPGRLLTFLRRALKGLVWNNPLLSGQRSTMFFGLPRRTLEGDGKWWDVYVDPYLEAVEPSYYYIESHRQGHPTPTKTSRVKHADLAMMVAFIGRKLMPIRLGEHEAQTLIEAERELKARFGVEVDTRAVARIILGTRYWLLRFYRLLLRRVRPKVAVFVSMNYPERAAVEACREAGVPVVELQHGVIAQGDLGYRYPAGAKARYFPDHLFVFGEYWKRVIDYPIAPERVTLVGFPYFDLKHQSAAASQRQDQIVVLSQPTIGADLSRFAAALVPRCAEAGWRVVYRLHPLERNWQSLYPWLRGTGVEVDQGDRGTLYELMGQSRIQIGVYSAAIFEGLATGLRTYLVDLPGVDLVQGLLDAKYAQLVSRPDEIDLHGDSSALPDRDLFFCRDSIARMDAALKAVAI